MNEQLTPAIETIIVSPGHNYVGRYGKEPLTHAGEPRERVRLIAGRGIKGDRYSSREPGHPKQITFFEVGALEALERELGQPVPPTAVRRNVFVRGIDLPRLVGVRFRLQGIRFEGVAPCRPCFWMDEAVAPGTEALLEGRGGLRAKILEDGNLLVGPAPFMVRTEDMGDKLTGDMGYTLSWAHALGRRVTNREETAICQRIRERAFHQDGALPGV